MIFLHEPKFSFKETKYVKECLKTGWVSTSGKFVSKFEKKVSEITNSKFCLALNSGTSSLDLSLKILDIQGDCEIIVPTTTFIAPINTILYNQAKPIFMDIDNFGNLNSEKVIKFIK